MYIKKQIYNKYIRQAFFLYYPYHLQPSLFDTKNINTKNAYIKSAKNIYIKSIYIKNFYIKDVYIKSAYFKDIYIKNIHIKDIYICDLNIFKYLTIYNNNFSKFRNKVIRHWLIIVFTLVILLANIKYCQQIVYLIILFLIPLIYFGLNMYFSYL